MDTDEKRERLCKRLYKSGGINSAIYWAKPYYRDYCFRVFERYCRIYKIYLPKYRQVKFALKVIKRYNWYSKAHIYFANQENIMPFTASGDFCPVITDGKCEYCGGPVVTHIECPKESWTVESFNEEARVGDVTIDVAELTFTEDSYYFSSEEIPWWNKRYAPFEWVDGECVNKLCNEALDFMDGRHDAREVAKSLSVQMRRPIKDWKKNWDSKENRLVIASAAMLDFEARVKIKQEKLEQRK